MWLKNWSTTVSNVNNVGVVQIGGRFKERHFVFRFKWDHKFQERLDDDDDSINGSGVWPGD